MKIVFFGTPEFAVASLDRLVEAGYEIAAVVTMPDRTGGRGNKVIESDVKKYAVARNLKLLQPEKLRAEEFLNELRITRLVALPDAEQRNCDRYRRVGAGNQTDGHRECEVLQRLSAKDEHCKYGHE